MRESSGIYLEIQSSIKQAKAHLRAMAELLACWKKDNQAAIIHLATAAQWESEETGKSQVRPAPEPLRESVEARE